MLPNFNEYCHRHGYRLLAIQCPEGPDIGFLKSGVILDHLSGPDPSDVLLCLDLDALITNLNTKVESFLSSPHSMFIAKDQTHHRKANSGSKVGYGL